MRCIWHSSFGSNQTKKGAYNDMATAVRSLTDLKERHADNVFILVKSYAGKMQKGAHGKYAV